MWDLSSVTAWSLNYWTTGEVPIKLIFKKMKSPIKMEYMLVNPQPGFQAEHRGTQRDQSSAELFNPSPRPRNNQCYDSV